ncbi:MAG TPA: exopolysaccharide biosynthesis polyprenyl glycosylphosphotransferase [Gaiellaceae bacterium]|jgi:exopolysaccharide biosynthesis polyprenyl glycosylphosphotransferase
MSGQRALTDQAEDVSAEPTGVVAPQPVPEGDPRYGPDYLLRRMLATADMLAVLLAAVAVAFWGGKQGPAVVLVLCAPIWIVVAKLARLYDRDQQTMRHLTVDEVPWLLMWALISLTLISLLLVPFPALQLTASDRVLVWLVTLGGAFFLRAGARGLWRRATTPERVLLVGDGPLAHAFARKLELFPDIHAEIAGRIENCADLHGRLDGISRKLDRIVIACSEFSEELLEELLPFCRVRGLRLTVIPPSRGMFGGATHLGHIADLPLLDYNTWDISPSTLALKRLFDVVVGGLTLLVMLPILLLVAVAVLIDGGLPVIFRQTRAGQDGAPFVMLKFRTMVRNAEELLQEIVPFEGLEDPMFKLRADPRVTRVGRILRRTSIDELPQLVNVIRGEMSLVGPRPEQLDLVERYLPEHRFRLKVKPGITGPMQVYGRGHLEFGERLAVEREYIENLTLLRDVRILLMTVPAVFGRRGAF